ncbi:NAD(P)-binding protein [Athelia psychrophila]|uniref:NAD(P)-binding protein n=1 Tax=Athelia psychrophila TaxID=1759441 RepID=A0A166TTB2_9AGAM|nr:NAD(P)-binding protein [Fibularhizoctonia sp. CBS 109695]
MDLGLQDAHVLITGASGGIGVEIARLFLCTYASTTFRRTHPHRFLSALNAKVTAHYNTHSTPLGPLSAEYSASRLYCAQAALSSETEVAALFTNAAAQFGPVQVVVVSHGYWEPANTPLVEMSLERWQSTLDSNLTSSFLVAREYLRGLSGAPERVLDGASIVFVGSTAGKFGEKDHADYATAKSALMYGLTRTLKNEIVKIAKKGRVNCVAPGWTMTPHKAESLRDPAVLYMAVATTPLKKVASSLDIANQIALLASAKISGHITGELVVVAGGMEGRILNTPEDM